MIRLLIVDDEAAARDLLVKALRQKSEMYDVVGVAGDGAQALELALLLRPDVAVTDIYMPGMNGLEFLQKAQEAELPLKAVVISGYDEFAYARQAITLGVTEYLLKPFLPSELFEALGRITEEFEHQRMLVKNISSLRKIVDEQAIELRERLYAQLLHGELKNVPSSSEAVLFDFNAPFYCAGQMNLSSINANSTSDAFDGEKATELLKILHESYFPEGIALYGNCIEPTQMGVLFSGYAKDERSFFEKVQMGLAMSDRSLKKHYNLNMRCALGRVCHSFDKLGASYEEALSVWRISLQTEQRIIVYGERLNEASEPQTDATKQIRKIKEQIILEVGLGRENSSRDRVEELMRCYAALSSKKSDYIYISVGELVYALTSALEERCNLSCEALSQRAVRIRERLEYSSLIEMKEALCDYVAQCCRWIKENNDSGDSSRLISQMCTVIESELEDPGLNLETLAVKLNFSPHYIRQIFKQHMGESFTDYVIRQRMEKAGALLASSTMLIQDVAIACGYANQRYFASSFKKFYGHTPTEYKQIIDREGEK